MADDFAQVQVQTQWQLNPMVQPTPVNQILIQEGAGTQGGRRSGELYLTFGHVMPPAIMPGPDGAISQEALNGVIAPIIPVGQYVITLERLREFRDVLDRFLNEQPPQQ